MTMTLRFLKQHLIILAIVRIAELSLLFGLTGRRGRTDDKFLEEINHPDFKNSALIWSRLPAEEDLRVEFFNFGDEEEVQWSNFCKLHKAKIHF